MHRAFPAALEFGSGTAKPGAIPAGWDCLSPGATCRAVVPHWVPMRFSSWLQAAAGAQPCTAAATAVKAATAAATSTATATATRTAGTSGKESLGSCVWTKLRRTARHNTTQHNTRVPRVGRPCHGGWSKSCRRFSPQESQPIRWPSCGGIAVALEAVPAALGRAPCFLPSPRGCWGGHTRETRGGRGLAEESRGLAPATPISSLAHVLSRGPVSRVRWAPAASSHQFTLCSRQLLRLAVGRNVQPVAGELVSVVY